MRKLILLTALLSFTNVYAQSFDPSLITAMDAAELALDEELAVPEQVQCNKIYKKIVSAKSKSYKACMSYRASLKSYKESIQHARSEIQQVTDWEATNKLFVLPPNNHVFLNLPSRVVKQYNPILVSKLDNLYTSIYQFPLIK